LGGVLGPGGVGSGGVVLGEGHEVCRGLRVGGAHERRARKDEGRDGCQGAVTRLGRVGQRLAVDESGERDDGVLVGDDQGLAAACFAQGRGEGRAHPGGDVTVGFAPRGAQRVTVVLEILRVSQHRAIRVHGQTFEDVVRLDEAKIGGNAQAVGGGGWRGRQLGAQQRRRDDASDIRTRIHQILRGARRHLMPQLRQTETGQTPVQNTVGIIHFSVAHDVNDGAVHNAQV